MDTMNSEEFSLNERFLCLECGVLPFLCTLKGYVCFDRMPQFAFIPKRPRWYNRLGNFIIENFNGIIGFLGVDLCSSSLAFHFGLKGLNGFLFGVGAGFLGAYVFIVARKN